MLKQNMTLATQPVFVEDLEPRTLLSATSARTYEIGYLKLVADHHLSGVMMANLALKKAQNGILRDLADQASADQAREIKKVQNWLKDYYNISYKPKVSTNDQSTIKRLSKLSGGAFDVEFSEVFIDHHAMIIQTSDQAADRVVHGKVEDLAEHIITEQGADISMLARVLESYPSNTDAGQPPQNTLTTSQKRSYEIQYLEFTADHHMGGVKMAQLAIDKAQRPWLHTLASRAKKDQLSEISLIVKWLKDLYGIAYTPKVTADTKQVVNRLSKLRGAVFDVEFSQEFIKHHLVIVEKSDQAVDRVLHDKVEGLAEHIMDVQGDDIAQLGNVLQSYPMNVDQNQPALT